MSESASPPTTTTEPLYDIYASLPGGVDIDILRNRAIKELGLSEAKVVPLLDALRRTSSIKIGSNVTKEKANQATADFQKIGLKIDLKPVLALDAISKFDDGKVACPACDVRVLLPENRQCPACGIFVDKVDAEFLMRKKLLAKERAIAGARADQEAKDAERQNLQDMERRIREEIRAEIEKEMGLDKEKQGLFGGFFNGKQGLVRGLIVTGAMVGAVVLGRVSNSIPGLGGEPPKPDPKIAEAAKQNAAQQDINKMMGAVDAGGAAGMDVGGAPLDDPTADESLMQNGKKGMSVEQAVAAASALGKAVGNNTIQNAMGSGAGLPGGKAGGGATGAVAAVGPDGKPILGADGNPIAAAASNAAPAPEFTLPTSVRTQLSSEFAVRLAEMGQSRRGKEILKSLSANPEVIVDLPLAASVRLAEIELRAWAVNGMSVGGARSEIEAINRDIGMLSGTTDRVLALSRAAAAFAEARRVTGAAAPGFISLAGEALKSTSKENQASVMGEWAVAMGVVILSDITEHARQGQWKPAEAAYERLSSILSQAGTPEAAAGLAGIDYRARMVLGQTAKADSALETGISRALKAANQPQQANALYALITRARIGSTPKLEEALTKLTTAVESSKAADRPQALGALAQVYAAIGKEEKAFALRQEASSSTGTATPEAQALATSNWVKVDMSLARARHRESAFAPLEVIVQRIAGYLL
jgi:hypothetical protein